MTETACMFTHPVTYCTNIHPGESWGELLANVENHGLAVKQACSPEAPFPLGLRVSGRASLEATTDEARRFGAWLQERGLYVATLNGFPYGAFHGQPVKEKVYLPDWRDEERAAYTKRLAQLLALWLPQGMTGSISSVPLAFGRELPDEEFRLARGQIMAALEHLARLHEHSGARILLSLEPEPGCYLERSTDLVECFTRLDLPPRLMTHLACCYDCCHQALQYEDPCESLALLRAQSITIGHVQVSSALHLGHGDLSRLRRFDESVYLHQTVARTENGLQRHDDLPQALRCEVRDAASWRVHFHLPVFLEKLPECETTRDFLVRALPLFPRETPLEVETYTWDVLPEDLRTATVTESIIREIRWVERARRGEEC